MNIKETSLIVFSDGFGCMAVTDTQETASEVVQVLNDDSPWEVVDGVEKKPKGFYSVKLNYWWEDNFPESGASLITEVDECVKVCT